MKLEQASINKYLPIAVLYFFLNGLFLPLGLLYTTLLTPFFLIWLARYPIIRHVGWYFVFVTPFVIIHFIHGVSPFYYLTSFTLFFCVFVFCLTFYQFLQVCKSLGSIYRDLVVLNFIFTIVAIIAFFIPFFRPIFWNSGPISFGIEVARLKLLTYEPSYYSTLLAPVALYYYLKAIMKKLRNPALMLTMISIPLILSFSFGVILAIMIAMAILFITHLGVFFPKRKLVLYILVGGFIASVGIVVLVLLFPENLFLKRLSNVFAGRDTSFKGRTYDAFYLGWEVAKMKSIIWGTGLGQTKILGLKLWQTYYQNGNLNVNSIAIPNAVGDTLATFGIVGLCIRFAFQVVLFFRTRVYNSYYRLLLFLFVFIYQFTGSYLFNIAEYVIWILAFSNVFPDLDKKTSNEKVVS